jgi:hypothetical protein
MRQAAWVPEPNTEHPSFERQARFVRDAMSKGRHRILLARPLPRSPARFLPPDAPVETSAPAMDLIVLQVKKCAGPAPWTEREYRYVWRVAVEEGTNRWVAGDATVLHRSFGWNLNQ